VLELWRRSGIGVGRAEGLVLCSLPIAEHGEQRMTPNSFFARLWDDYVDVAPRAAALREAVERREERVVNDHVAFRTLNLSPINIEALEPHLLQLGYRRHEPYHFAKKKLDAWSYAPPNAILPRVFLSELRVEELSPDAQTVLRRLASEVDASSVSTPEAFWAGRLWAPTTRDEYIRLADESEYAGWVAALGLRANHFTIAVHELEHFDSLESLLQFVESKGAAISDAGGRIKGSPEVYLEQASTIADEATVCFADGELTVPTCYYEFALRHRQPDGSLYEGFVPASADKIFESTDR
jgi:hypothetical protein